MKKTKTKDPLKKVNNHELVISAEALFAKAKKVTVVTWIDTHPLREQIIECLKRGAPIAGLVRALHEEGFKDATKSKLHYVKQQLAAKG